MAKTKGSKGKARSNPKGNTSRMIGKALDTLGRTYEALNAIEEIAKNLEAMKDLDSISFAYAIGAMCDRGRDIYADAADDLAHLRHPAIPFLRKAADALDYAETITKMSRQDDCLGGLARRTLRKSILAFMAESGRWSERAREALGEPGPYTGWTDDLLHIEGLPEGARLAQREQQ